MVVDMYLYFSSSSSGAVFFEKVGCHDPPWLPILSQSHEVFISRSRPICGICHPLRGGLPLGRVADNILDVVVVVEIFYLQHNIS